MANKTVDIKLTNPFGDTATYTDINSVTFSDTNDNEQIFYLQGTDPTMEGGGVSIPEAADGETGQFLGINEYNRWAIVDNPLPKIDGTETPNTILGVQGGQWTKVELTIPKQEPELPDPTSYEVGSVLTIVEEGENKKWEPQPSLLPEITTDNEGQILGINNEGKIIPIDHNPLPKPNENGTDKGKILIVNENNAWETQYMPAPLQPILNTSEENNGQFLRVQNGQPVWMTVPQAEGVSF